MSDLKGFNELSKMLKSLEAKAANKIVRRGTAKMAQVVRKEMRNQAPRKTGKLNKNLKYTTKRLRAGGYSAKVGAFNDAYYAKFIEGGTKPHSIPKKRKRNQKTVSFGGGVYSKVQHPGTRAKPFIERAFKSSRSRAIKEAGKVMFKLMVK